jgi:hypothetical protein
MASSPLVWPYDTAQTALTDAIIFANDAGSPAGLSGNILNPDTNPAVLPALQERYRYLQQRLISSGVDTFTKEAVVYDLLATTSSNPQIKMRLTYNGYWNGQYWTGPYVTAPTWSSSVTYTAGMTVVYSGVYYVLVAASSLDQEPDQNLGIWAVFTPGTLTVAAWSSGTTYTQGQQVSYGNSYYTAQPNSTANTNKVPDQSPLFWARFAVPGAALPADLIKPLECWEVQYGTITGGWIPMQQVPDALNPSLIQPRFRQWGFANDELILPGASYNNNLRIKYIAAAPDITTLDTYIYPRGVSTALALLLLDQLSGARGGPMAQIFKERAEEAISQIINQTVRKQAYAQFVRRPYRGNGLGHRATRSEF